MTLDENHGFADRAAYAATKVPVRNNYVQKYQNAF